MLLISIIKTNYNLCDTIAFMIIKNVKINNFRSVEKQSIDLAPLTFLYGNNAVGKSSLFYALNILRNIVTDPGQPVDKFFDLGFANLGTFKQVVFKHEDTKSITIAVSGKHGNTDFTYGVKINPKQSEFFVEIEKPYSLKLRLPVTFPYTLNGNLQEAFIFQEITYSINWTGVVAQVTPTTVNEETNKQAKTIAYLLNRGVQLVRNVDLVPLRRGFSKPQYGVVNITQFPITEEEVASLLAVDDYLDSKLSTYLEQTIDRQFRAKPQSGTSLTSLTTIEKVSKISSDIVNDGFGVNQLVYLLAKTLNKNAITVCIEEPEINLHPSVVRKVPHTLIELVKDEGKQLIVSTHSESLILALLSAIAREEITTNDVICYLTTRLNGVTDFTKQEITEDGQISEGLISFMGGELEDIETFFKAKKKNKGKKENKKDLSDAKATETIATNPSESKADNQEPNSEKQ